jgi:hypothetical protein
MTTDEIMALVDRFAYEVCYPAYFQSASTTNIPFPVQDVRASLRTAIEALQADAARYRWLRSSNASNEWNRLGHYGVDALDSAIDAAMALDREAQLLDASYDATVARVFGPLDKS